MSRVFAGGVNCVHGYYCYGRCESVVIVRERAGQSHSTFLPKHLLRVFRIQDTRANET